MSYWVIGEVPTGLWVYMILYGWFLHEHRVVVGSIRWISDSIPVADCHSNIRQEKKMNGLMQLDLAIGSRAAKQFSSLWRGWHRWLGIKHVNVLADFVLDVIFFRVLLLPVSPRVRHRQFCRFSSRFVSFPRFWREMSKPHFNKDRKPVGNSCSHSLWGFPCRQIDHVRIDIWFFLTKQAGQVNNGQFEENYYGFWLFEEPTGDTLVFLFRVFILESGPASLQDVSSQKDS